MNFYDIQLDERTAGASGSRQYIRLAKWDSYLITIAYLILVP